MIKAATFSIAVACVAFLNLAAQGDTLVTNSGSRYEGTVTEDADGYILVTPKGGKMSFPKNMVEKVTPGPIATQPAPTTKPVSPATTKPTTSPASRPAPLIPPEKALKQVLPKLDFSDTPLQDVVNFLSQSCKINFVVNWDKLAAEGIDKTKAVNIHLTGTTCEKALKLILQDVGDATPLGYYITDGVVVISTTAHIETLTVTKVYDISGLLVQGRGTRGEQINGIIANIQVIFPGSWKPAGNWSMAELNGKLVVTASRSGHDRISELLKQMAQGK
jgi:type II secretory pathway component GspD/PulD (secretin)